MCYGTSRDAYKSIGPDTKVVGTTNDPLEWHPLPLQYQKIIKVAMKKNVCKYNSTQKEI